MKIRHSMTLRHPVMVAAYKHTLAKMYTCICVCVQLYVPPCICLYVCLRVCMCACGSGLWMCVCVMGAYSQCSSDVYSVTQGC